MLINNKSIITSKNSKLAGLRANPRETACEIIETKSGTKTLLVNQDGQTITYHSRYNPQQEAKTLLTNQLTDTTEYVLLIGVGLGYLVEELNESYPHVQYSIFEPNVAIMKSFLDNFDLSKVKKKNLDEIFTSPTQIKSIDKFFLKLAEPTSTIIISPVAEKLYKDTLVVFNTNLKEFLTSHKTNVTTNLRFQLRWTTNSIVNFSEVLSTPNFFKDIDLTKLTGKPALIVAAGPSLDDEIENIRFIKEHGKAYIFAVGAAVNSLIKNNILPDALITYDPTLTNSKVVQRIKDLGLNIPLIFGTTVGYEVLESYPGPKLHFFTTQDSINRSLVNEENSVVIPDAPTVAAIALYIIGGIKMEPVILVGQNLSITKEKRYAEGIDYVGNVNVSEESLKVYEPAKSTTNDKVYVNQGFLEMRNALEKFIISTGLESKVFNGTKNGLPIKNAPYIPFNEIIENKLVKNNIVDSTIFNGKNKYNIDDALLNFKYFENDFDSLIIDFKKLVEIDKKIQGVYEKKIINNIQATFDEFDKYFIRIEKNTFFIKVLAPITRTQYKELINKSATVRFEIRPLQKMEKYLDTYSRYIRTIYAGIILIQPAFAELKKSDLFKKED